MPNLECRGLGVCCLYHQMPGLKQTELLPILERRHRG